MVDQLYPEISKKEFEKILSKLTRTGKENREALKKEVSSKKQKVEKPEGIPKPAKDQPEENEDLVEKKVHQIETKAVYLIVNHLRRKGYSEEFIQKNMDLIEDAIYDILYA